MIVNMNCVVVAHCSTMTAIVKHSFNYVVYSLSTTVLLKQWFMYNQTHTYALQEREVSTLLHSLTVPTRPRDVTITRVLLYSVELNWLPPTEPNGEVHYVIYYTPEGGTEQSIDTGSNLTHYNLTGLERNRVYTNIAVQAFNSVGDSYRSAVIAHYNHTPPGEL